MRLKLEITMTTFRMEATEFDKAVRVAMAAIMAAAEINPEANEAMIDVAGPGGGNIISVVAEVEQ